MSALQRLGARYLDINSLYGIDTRPELVADLEAIYNSLYNLFNCPIGARFWEPEYGCALKHFLQEPCDNETAMDIEVSLLQSIMRWEPRLDLDRALTRVRMMENQMGYYIDVGGTDRVTGRRFVAQFAAFRDQSVQTDVTI